MISVICVYHNRDLLNRSLLPSLLHQDEHQLILIDNESPYSSLPSESPTGGTVALRVSEGMSVDT